MSQFHFEHLVRRAREMQHAYHFTSRWRNDPQTWQKEWGAKLRELLGQFPPRCDPAAQWQHLENRECYSLHRVSYFTEPGLQAFAFVAIPHDIPDGGAPGVLCLHGHGPLGAYPVMNYGDDPRLAAQVTDQRYDYGHRFAGRGAIVFAPNLRGFGERLTERERQAQASDPCNVNFWMQMLLGEIAITSQLHDLKMALDILESIPGVRPGALGCAGLSYGGRLTTFFAAIEPRIAAAVVAGALNSFVERIESYSCCGFQVVPGLLRYGDTAEVLGLIAPRPLAVELGNRDSCCPLKHAHCEFERLQMIYNAMDIADRLKLFEFEGGHIFHGEHSIPWLLNQL